MKFYVLPTMRVNAWLVKIFREWVSTPGRKGRKRNPKNPKWTLSYKKYSHVAETSERLGSFVEMNGGSGVRGAETTCLGMDG